MCKPRYRLWWSKGVDNCPTCSRRSCDCVCRPSLNKSDRHSLRALCAVITLDCQTLSVVLDGDWIHTIIKIGLVLDGNRWIHQHSFEFKKNLRNLVWNPPHCIQTGFIWIQVNFFFTFSDRKIQLNSPKSRPSWTTLSCWYDKSRDKNFFYASRNVNIIWALQKSR